MAHELTLLSQNYKPRFKITWYTEIERLEIGL